MRKQGSQDISSFDMLLDTMCNTFGGIVFIALLLSILAGSVGQRQEAAVEEVGESLDEVEYDIELSQLVREQSEQEAAITHLTSSLEIARDGAPDVALDLSALVASNVTLRGQADELKDDRDNLVREIAGLRKSNEVDNVSAADLEIQLAQLREDLRSQKQNSTRTLRMPREHQVAGKANVFLSLKNKKFFAVSDVARRDVIAQQRGYDEADVTVETGPGQVVIEVRGSAGQKIAPGSESVGKFAAALRNLNRDREVVFFLVYADSFAEFNYVKSEFVKQGFDYNWGIQDGAIQLTLTSDLPSAQ